MDPARQSLASTVFKTYWLDSIDLPLVTDSLVGEATCELLIVGGGFCGLWCAIQAKEQNPSRDVMLIEARQIGNGASARPAAIMSTSVMHGIHNTERNFPDDVEALEELGRENMDEFRAALERYEIDCDVEWTGELTVSVGDEGLEALNHELDLYLKYGHEAVGLDKEQIRDHINSPIFHAGVWSRRRGGTVHPGKLVCELKRVAIELGVRVHENTPHLSNRYSGSDIVVQVPGGSIHAEKVFLATNAWGDGHPKISRRVAAIRDRILVTEPLTPEQIESVGWKNRQGIYDTRTQLNYLRLTRDNRILFGGRLAYFFGNHTDPELDRTPEPYIRLANAFFRTLPQLKGKIAFSHAWSGPIGLTTRMAVHYQRYHQGNMIYAGGYSGFGVTATRFGARVGLALLDKRDTPETRLAFARTVPGYIPPEPFRWIGAQITMYAVDTVDAKGGWRVPWLKFVERLGFPVTS